MADRRALAGKVAVITGGTRGVGRALGRELASKGVKVAVCARDDRDARAVAREIGAGAVGRGVDVSDADAYRAFVDEVERELGPLDILVNNAGIMPIGRFDEESDATTQRILDVNLGGVVFATKDAAVRMKARRSGHIVNVASAAGWVAGGGAATYCASKFGVVGFSESVALELHDRGIDVSVVGPGVVDTELSDGVKRMPGLRVVSPEEVAGAIVDVLERPRFAAFMPRRIGVLAKVSAVLPYSLRHRLLHLTHTATAVLDADMAERRSYEARAGAAPVAVQERAEDIIPTPTSTGSER
jgi:NAD(P)-dependent dehydrogenase (short-subunit alcohol dehydrogenase family)